MQLWNTARRADLIVLTCQTDCLTLSHERGITKKADGDKAAVLLTVPSARYMNDIICQVKDANLKRQLSEIWSTSNRWLMRAASSARPCLLSCAGHF